MPHPPSIPWVPEGYSGEFVTFNAAAQTSALADNAESTIDVYDGTLLTNYLAGHMTLYGLDEESNAFYNATGHVYGIHGQGNMTVPSTGAKGFMP